MPTTSALLAFAGATLLLAMIPGPSLLFAISRAISAGRREALLAVAGNSLGLFAQSIAVAAGLAPVIAASAGAFTAIKVAGAAYLIYLGISAIRHRVDTSEALISGAGGQRPAHHALRQGFVVGVTNPKTVVFLAALLPQFVVPNGAPYAAQIIVLGLVFMLVGMASDLSFAALAGRARDWFARSPQRLAALSGVGGFAMIGLGGALLLTGRDTA